MIARRAKAYKTDFLDPNRVRLRLVSFSVATGVASCIISHLRNGYGFDVAGAGAAGLVSAAGADFVTSCNHSLSTVSE